MALLAEIEVENEPVVAETRTPVDLSSALLIDDTAYGATDLVPQLATVEDATNSSTDAPRHGTGRRAAPETGTPLTGSVLSPQTWREMAQVLREKSVRT
jgi:hypothetical protein